MIALKRQRGVPPHSFARVGTKEEGLESELEDVKQLPGVKLIESDPAFVIGAGMLPEPGPLVAPAKPE